CMAGRLGLTVHRPARTNISHVTAWRLAGRLTDGASTRGPRRIVMSLNHTSGAGRITPCALRTSLDPTDLPSGDVMSEPDSCTPVVCRMLVRLVVAEGVDRQVMLDLSYDRADPYAVSLAFHMCTDATVRWVIG